MSRAYSIKDSIVENRIFLGRVVAIFLFILLLITALVIRLIYLQVVGHEQYTSMAKSNRIKLAPIPPTRGIIYDRKGKILADNIPTYTLELILEQISDLDDTLQKLQKLLNIPAEKINQFHRQRKRQKRFNAIPLLLHMSDEQVAKFAVVRHSFPGVDIHAGLLRHYPYSKITSHVVGYLGRINENEMKSVAAAEYSGTHHIGKTGIEKSFETKLHGSTGYAEIETNAQGRTINTRDTRNPEPGSNLYLNLDIGLQQTAYDALDIYNGAIIAIEIATGGVLVFTSRPSFDPNLFVSGISNTDYKALQDSDDRPLFNRALRGLYPPGSTIKPFLGLAALENQTVKTRTRLFCPGFYRLPRLSHKYRDWKKRGHGSVRLKDAIIQSCDVYFYDLAYKLGIERIHNFLQQFGFGEKTGIELIGEKSGLIPSKKWKKTERNEPWYHGETIITGIGQGFTQVTALQLARATATLANQGTIVYPRLVQQIVGSNSTSANKTNVIQSALPLQTANINHIIDAMINVVHGAKGTAKRISKDIEYLIAGKTGTAQVFSVKQEEKYSEEEIAFKLRDHAMFIAFAPADNPQIAIAVIVENGGHGGSVAAPIAAKLIKKYLSEQVP
jgi:penicillin-binding protein 2